MNCMISEVLASASFTNKNDFYQFAGHTPELIQDSRLSRVGWISNQSVVSGEMYGEGIYGHTLYGEIVLASSTLVMTFDCGKNVTFDTLGIANHNLILMDFTIEWGTTAGVYNHSATIGPIGVTSEAIYNKFLATPGTGRYIRITMRNPTESGIVRMGRFMLGLNYALPTYRTVYDTNMASNSLAQYSDSRQLYGTKKTNWRKLSFELVPGDIREQMHTLMKTLDRHQATLWEFNETCMPEENLYGSLENVDMALVTDDARLYTGRITLQEAR